MRQALSELLDSSECLYFKKQGNYVSLFYATTEDSHFWTMEANEYSIKEGLRDISERASDTANSLTYYDAAILSQFLRDSVYKAS